MTAWITSGGYKYLQLGEGDAILRIPPHAHDVRPAITGWFAEFDVLTMRRDDPHAVSYGTPASRFAGGTYDPASTYRGARVFRFFGDVGLTPALLHEVLPAPAAGAGRRVRRPRPPARGDRPGPGTSRSAGSAASSPSSRRQAGEVRAALTERGVLTDRRADRLRVGPAPYLSDQQLVDGMAVIGEVAAARSLR